MNPAMRYLPVRYEALTSAPGRDLGDLPLAPSCWFGDAGNHCSALLRSQSRPLLPWHMEEKESEQQDTHQESIQQVLEKKDLHPTPPCCVSKSSFFLYFVHTFLRHSDDRAINRLEAKSQHTLPLTLSLRPSFPSVVPLRLFLPQTPPLSCIRSELTVSSRSSTPSFPY